MSPRQPGTDAEGRPIVAELGRAETPLETAERKSAASAKRRSNQTAVNLAIALVASLAIVAFLVMVVVRPDQGPIRPPVDYLEDAEAAQSAVDEPLVAPELPEGWEANRAELVVGSDGVTSWQIGFITPDQQYIALLQGIDANPSWVDDAVHGAKAGDIVSIGGVDWTSYDRRDVSDPGNMAYALVTTSGASTIVLAGTADDAEFAVLAEAVAKDLG